MMRKAFVLFAVLLLFAGCPGEGDDSLAPTEGGKKADTPGMEEHFTLEEGTSTQASAGEREEEELAPAIEYSEDVNANLFIYFITVGYEDTQGDAILIKKGQFDMVVDAGPVAMKREVVNFLLAKGVDDIEVLVSTHDDPEHSGGLEYVAENFRIGEVWRPKEGSEEYGAMLDSLEAEHGVKEMGRGNERIFNGMHVLVRNPQLGEERFHDTDNDGIVLRIEDRGFCTLLTADIDGSAQAQVLMDSEPCEVVQMPWHGMSEGLSSLDFFFDKLEPEDIIVSGSSKDWTDTRQTLYLKADLRELGVYENYDGEAVKVSFNGMEYSIEVE